ncbi:flagellar brake protein [Paenibacillus bouchesdurhonensis]|uniref:flagellar brake protein n=1 Tax=Paenibacillus bouchesdurhonensis TaxID=1870990 RepID=UPI000DA5F8B7|nr:PilZ domain-containing protein [Paenibacillus bouchesdurhonensis]
MEGSAMVEFWKGQLLELQTFEGVMYKTQIIHQDHNRIYIQKPINRMNRYLSVTSQMSVTVYFHNEERVLYSFDTQIYLQRNQLSFQTPSVDRIKKAQRRRFFRVPVEVELNLNLKSIERSEEDEFIKVTTKDISGGGLSFLCDFAVETEMLIAGIMHLETNNSQNIIEFHGKIVNCAKLPDNNYKISLEFVHMKESIRSDIIKYCLFKQVEARNKLKNYSL